MHPFPFIKELSEINRITGFNDILKIMDFVYSLIPWTGTPNKDPITMENIEPLYGKFRALETGGWCGLNAEFFKWIIEGYRKIDPFNIRYRSYNHGIHEQKFTHIGVVVEFDRMEFFFDPYFNRYYRHRDGFPLQLESLLFFIRERRIDKYESVFLDSKKPVIRCDGTVEHLAPQQLLQGVIEGFELRGFSKVMKSVFNGTNPDLLMLLKIAD